MVLVVTAKPKERQTRMMKHIIEAVTSLLAVFMMFGCTTVPERISAADVAGIKCLVLETRPYNSDLQALDLVGIRQKEYSKQYGGVMYGAIGG